MMHKTEAKKLAEKRMDVLLELGAAVLKMVENKTEFLVRWVNPGNSFVNQEVYPFAPPVVAPKRGTLGWVKWNHGGRQVMFFKYLNSADGYVCCGCEDDVNSQYNGHAFKTFEPIETFEGALDLACKRLAFYTTSQDFEIKQMFIEEAKS